MQQETKTQVFESGSYTGRHHIHRRDLPAHDRVAFRLEVAQRPFRLPADDCWGLRHSGRIPIVCRSQSARPSQPDLVHRLVERGSRRYHGRPVVREA